MDSKEPQNVGIIGGGLAGLSAACVLASRGHRVTLFEKNPWLGGKAAILEADGYRFDMGPTILTIPSVLRKIFREAGKNLEDYLELIRLDPQWRCFYDDGSILDLFANVDEMADKLESYHPGSGEGYRNFQKFAERMNSITHRFFFYRSVGGMRDMIDLSIGFKPQLLADVLAMRMGRSVASTVRKYISDNRIAQMLDHFVQYIGSSPDQSPAVLCGIAHMQSAEGVWYPKGGTGAVPKALTRLASELGVDLRTGIGISRIGTDARNRQITGLETDSGEFIEFDAVVSNCDSVRTHRELLGNDHQATRRFNRRRKYEPACSGVVLYLGLKKKYDHLLHHNFIFSKDPHVEFDSIYHCGEPAPDPTCYVAAPGLTEPEVAPSGGEALYVLVHTPYLRKHHDWKAILPKYREVILHKMKTTGAMPDIEERIQFESVLTPQEIHDRYRVLNGAIYGLASHGKWLGAFKPANRSKDVQGLYLAGGAAHPGPGMPMVLMSGWIAADVLDRDATNDSRSAKERSLATTSSSMTKS
jgi:diapolycopene oxygenase